MAGRRPVSRHPRITSQPMALPGGGTQSGSLNIGEPPAQTPRQVVEDRRAEVADQSVGEALTERMMQATPEQMPDFLAVLEAVRREADAGDRRAANAYGYALNQLSQRAPEKWMDFFEGSEIDDYDENGRPMRRPLTKEEWQSYFLPGNEMVSPSSPELSVPPAVVDATDVAAVETQLPSPVVGNTIDLESLLMGFGPPRPAREGGELAAQVMPANAASLATRADFPWRLSMFLNSQNDLDGKPRTDAKGNIVGPADIAKQFYFDDRVPSSNRAMFPELESVANIRMLAQMTGVPFTPALPDVVDSGMGPRVFANSHVRPAMEMIREATEYDPASNSLVFRPGVDPAQVTADVRQRVGYADPAQVQSLLAGLTSQHPTLSAAQLEAAARGSLGGYDGSVLVAPSGVMGTNRYERDILNSARSPQQKMGEAIDAVLRGRSRMLDLDALTAGPNNVPYWRNDTFIAPHTSDYALIRGQLPPEVLSTLIAQQLGRREPSYIANLVPYVDYAMERQIDTPPPTPKATQYAPPHFTPTAEWLKAIDNFYRTRGMTRPPVQLRQAAPPAPATPAMTDTSMMPNTPRFSQYRTNPLTSLIG